MNELNKKLCLWLKGRQVVVVCIGTDLVGGDCLGPLVGQMLVESGAPAFVYGTLDNPVSALNIDEINGFISKRHAGSVVLAVDASVGEGEGKISLTKGALLPGAADGKKLKSIGDISLTAVTSSFEPCKKEFALVRLGFVYGLAKRLHELITCGLSQAVSIYYNNSAGFAIGGEQKEIRV